MLHVIFARRFRVGDWLQNRWLNINPSSFQINDVLSKFAFICLMFRAQQYTHTISKILFTPKDLLSCWKSQSHASCLLNGRLHFISIHLVLLLYVFLHHSPFFLSFETCLYCSNGANFNAMEAHAIQTIPKHEIVCMASRWDELCDKFLPHYSL